ncbi:MAG: hypothetical protein COA58_15785 [Bacteroidetes bacterium]|nr:MAG: hypothetical protein COA58_15785 [Bacteroidota bacterium]
MNAIICPISTEKINLNVSRITVFINVILMGLFFYTNNPIFIVLVLADYFIRAFLKAEYSPIRFIAVGIVKALNMKGKTIDLAQKVFASRLGMLCALAALLFFYFDNQIGTYISLGMLMVLSFADSVFNFCVGCLIYNYIVFPFHKNK